MLSQLLARSETLFIIDDIIADEGFDKRRQSLLELAISGRCRGHYLWLLTHSYCAIPKSLWRQAKILFLWYGKEMADLKMIHDENNVLKDDKLVVVRDFFKELKTCVPMHTKWTCSWIKLLNHVWGDHFKWAKWTHLMF